MQAQKQQTDTQQQLSLNFYDGFFVPQSPQTGRLVKTVTFPRHIEIPNFGQFQRQVNALFAPFGIEVEFSLSRQRRLQMSWIFPSEDTLAEDTLAEDTLAEDTLATGPGRPPVTAPAHKALSDEEMTAFTNVVFAFAGQNS